MPPLAFADIPVTQVLRSTAIGRISLHIHALNTTAIDEVVDVVASPRGREGGVHIALGEPERAHFLLVDVDVQRSVCRQGCLLRTALTRDPRAPPLAGGLGLRGTHRARDRPY